MNIAGFGSNFGSHSGFGFSAFSVMFTIVFVLIITVFVITLVKGLTTWNKNNHSPVLTVDATVVTKRQNVSHHTHSGNDNMAMSSSSSTTYYVTFQVESGDRMELHVSGDEYGLLAEGDMGKLTFQGTRYKSFVRQ